MITFLNYADAIDYVTHEEVSLAYVLKVSVPMRTGDGVLLMMDIQYFFVRFQNVRTVLSNIFMNLPWEGDVAITKCIAVEN